MQGCRRDRFVLSAVVAISAMSVSVKLIKDAKDETSLGTAIRHRELALEQHEKSLQAMREALSKNGDTACALTACLLVCFFESLSGNILTTINHARSVSDAEIHNGEKLACFASGWTEMGHRFLQTCINGGPSV